MESQPYIFEAQQGDLLIDGQPQMGQSRLLERQDDPNGVDTYAQLHLGEVLMGEQAIVYYERGESTGFATLEPTATTDGSYRWQMRDTRMTPDGPRMQQHNEVTVCTDDADGCMNRHLFLQPGDTLGMVKPDAAARIKTLGTIVSVHLVRMPREPQHSMAPVPVAPIALQTYAEVV